MVKGNLLRPVMADSRIRVLKYRFRTINEHNAFYRTFRKNEQEKCAQGFFELFTNMATSKQPFPNQTNQKQTHRQSEGPILPRDRLNRLRNALNAPHAPSTLCACPFIPVTNPNASPSQMTSLNLGHRPRAQHHANADHTEYLTLSNPSHSTRTLQDTDNTGDEQKRATATPTSMAIRRRLKGMLRFVCEIVCISKNANSNQFVLSMHSQT